VKHATKFWVCDVAKDWLTADSRLGAHEIQAKIKEKVQGRSAIQEGVLELHMRI
jgi:hypothetical protein